MPIETILTVKKKHLSELGPESAVDIYRELVWAEASSNGIPKSSTNIPSDIYDPDGGIDAKVTNSPVGSRQGIIRKGLTCYQVKTGVSDPSTAAQVKKILFKEGSNDLKPEVRECFDNKGTFVLVHFGWDGPEPKLQKSLLEFKTQLAKASATYKKVKVEIFPQNRLIGFIGQYPSLALRVNGKAEGQFRTHFGWSSEAEMKRPFVLAADHSQKIGTMQAELRRNDRPIHIHVVGEPGVGKTRLVLEVTKEDDLRPLVIYCDDPAKIMGR